MLFESKGVLRQEGDKLYVEVDKEIVSLTRSLLPASIRGRLNKQKYPPHISISRREGISSVVPEVDIVFEYDSEPVIGEIYSWLRVFSPQLSELRVSLGLSPSSELSRPPDGEECFHITIGNRKAL